MTAHSTHNRKYAQPTDVADTGNPACYGRAVGVTAINPNTGDNYARTHQGFTNTQAFQNFLGQTNAFAWGKAAFGPTENGGIQGVVYYDTMRGEDDPRYGRAEVYQPGIPGLTVRLRDKTQRTVLATTKTTSWDSNLPTGCQGPAFTFLNKNTDCYDGLRVFNQVRNGVFDGQYRFDQCWVSTDANGVKRCVAQNSPGATLGPIPPGEYVIEVVRPNGTVYSADGSTRRAPLYEVVKEEDKNLDFGETMTPSPLYLPGECVGSMHTVPQYLTWFPDQQIESLFAGQQRPLCDRRKVYLNTGSTAMADFFLFTEVPIAGHIYGFILDDTANEFDPASPQFGEKFAPPWLPVSVKDYTGREISRVYADQYGVFNALVPSTYTSNTPLPSGVSPAMITTCMNSRTKPDGTEDPFHNKQYAEFCYVLQYMPGATTYLDTPVVPVAAFAGPDQNPLDCEFPDGTPRINQVSVGGNGVNGGPFVARDPDGTISANQVVTITAMGDVDVPEPGLLPRTAAYQHLHDNQQDQEYQPRLRIWFDAGYSDHQRKPLTDVQWTPSTITGKLDPATGTGELVVTRGDNGKSSLTGVTVTVGLQPGQAIRVVSAPSAIDVYPGAIQSAIDNSNPGDLILVAPGVYFEPVVMWKRVQLQGWGEGSTAIDAVKVPAEKMQWIRTKLQQLVDTGAVDLVPGQEVAIDPGQPGIEPPLLNTEEGAGVLVLARQGSFTQAENARIDGFTIRGSDGAGGVIANGFASYLEISNNRISNNNGLYSGGIRLGHTELVTQVGANTVYPDAGNDHVQIHNNQITMNGGEGGVGGGVTLCPGSHYYSVTQNWVCGNFSVGDGGGIAHYGLSNEGSITNNSILFNENFYQGSAVSGGGILISGQPATQGSTISPGSGNVIISGNLIQGNAAGTGDGGGIRVTQANGQDIVSNRTAPNRWYTVGIYNNVIADNVAALAGGGISLQDSVKVKIVHNTIVNNDSTATSSLAFSPGNPNQSNPQPAGIVSRTHTPQLALYSTMRILPDTFSNPVLEDNIVWHNRSFYFYGDRTASPAVYKLRPDLTADELPSYADLGVLGGLNLKLAPKTCLLTSTTGYDPSNKSGNPSFAAQYVNGQRGVTINYPEATTAIEPPPAFDEGGNFIRIRFGPLTTTKKVGGVWVPRGDYHIQDGSSAMDAGNTAYQTYSLGLDFDGKARPDLATGKADIGATEIQKP